MEEENNGVVENQLEPIKISLNTQNTQTKSVVEDESLPVIKLNVSKVYEEQPVIKIPKYSYANFSQAPMESTPDYWEQYKYFYGVNDNAINLYKTKPSATEKVTPGYKLKTFEKYASLPQVNILSLGGDYQKYDDIINKVIALGNVNSAYDEEIRSAISELNKKSDTASFEYATFLTNLIDYDTFGEKAEKALTSLAYSIPGGLLKQATTLGKARTAITMQLESSAKQLENAGRTEEAGKILGNKETSTFSKADKIADGLLASAQLESSRIAKDVSGFENFLWNTGTSIVNNLVFLGLAAVTKQPKLVVMGLMGAQAGGQAAYQSAQAGGTVEQQIASSMLSTIAEAFFEGFSLDGLKALALANPTTLRAFVVNVGKQALIEGSEEFGTEIANILSDMAVMKDKSQMTQYFNRYIQQNPDKTNNQAFKKTFWNAITQVFVAGFSGALSGVAMGGGAQLFGMATNQQQLAKIRSYENARKQLDTTGKITETIDGKLMTAQQLRAYEATQIDTDGLVVESKDFNAETQINAIRVGIENGTTTQKEVRAISKFAKEKRLKLEYYNAEDGADGYYNPKTQTVYINTLSNEVVTYTTVHEYGHDLKITDPVKHQQYMDSIKELISSEKYYTDFANKITEQYRSNPMTKDISQEDLDEEIAWKISTELIKNNKNLENLVTKNESFAKRFLNWLKGLIGRTKTIDKEQTTPLRNAEKALENALKAKRAKTIQESKASGKEATKKSLNEQVKPKFSLIEQKDNLFKFEYNNKEFNINSEKLNTAGTIVIGDVLFYKRAVFTGAYPNSKFSHNEFYIVNVSKESYGEEKAQHTFTLEVLTKFNPTNERNVGDTIRVKGRNLYPNSEILSEPENFKEIAEEKHARGKIAKEEWEEKKYGVKYSLQDSSGNKLSQEQAEFFKDSDIRNENGNLQVAYHGTRAEFNKFEKSKGGEFGPGIYFATNKGDAEFYAKRTYKGNGNEKVISVYLNITNPYIIKKTDYIKKTENITPKTFMNKLIKQGHDGIIGIGINGIDKQIVAFEPNQIKLTTNLKPTANKDMRYSLKESPYRKSFTKVRNGWTQAKIIKELKTSLTNTGRISYAKSIIEYGSVKELEKNMYYHGTSGYFGGRLLPSIALRENTFAGGGYGEKYWGISLSKSRNIASNFTANSSYGSVYDVLLKKDATVIEMPEIEDSVELEDIIEKLWNDGIDAVKIGKWDDRYSEQEIVILNPKAIQVGKSIGFPVYQKQKFQNHTTEDFKELIKWAKEYKAESDAKAKREAPEKARKYAEMMERFRLNQIETRKLLDDINKNRDEKNKIKYSLKDSGETTDSQGMDLSDGQLQYFSKSKALDDSGRLAEVYHGTVSGEFNVFDASNSSFESDMGAGFYFSSSYDDVSANYEEGGPDLEIKIGRLTDIIASEKDTTDSIAAKEARRRLIKKSALYSVYLNIKNPAYVGGDYDTATNLVENFINDYDREDYTEDGEFDEDGFYSDIENAFYGEFLYEVERSLSDKGIEASADELSNIFQDLYVLDGFTINDLKESLKHVNFEFYAENGEYANNEVLRTIVEELGYDGIIDNSVKSKFKNMNGLYGDTRHYIVFNSNQIKLTENKTPTDSDDIRFSLGQQLKQVAQQTTGKSYSKTDAENTINSVIENILTVNDKYGKINGKAKNQAINMLWQALNSNDDYRAKAVLDIADYLIKNSVSESVFDSNAMAETAQQTVDTLKPYLKKIDLATLKSDIASKYDTNSAYVRWNKVGGIGVDVMAQELADFGIIIKAKNDADIFFEINDMYTNALTQLKLKTQQQLSEVGTANEIAELKQSITRELFGAWNEVTIKTYQEAQMQNKTMLELVEKKKTITIKDAQEILNTQMIELKGEKLLEFVNLYNDLMGDKTLKQFNTLAKELANYVYDNAYIIKMNESGEFVYKERSIKLASEDDTVRKANYTQYLLQEFATIRKAKHTRITKASVDKIITSKNRVIDSLLNRVFYERTKYRFANALKTFKSNMGVGKDKGKMLQAYRVIGTKLLKGIEATNAVSTVKINQNFKGAYLDYLKLKEDGKDTSTYVEENLKDIEDLLSQNETVIVDGVQLKILTDVLNNIRKMSTIETKLIGAEYGKSIIEIGQSVIKDINASGGIKKGGLIGGINAFYKIENLTPVNFFNQLINYNENSPLIEVFQNLVIGNENKIVLQRQMQKPFNEFLKKHTDKIKQWTGKDAVLEDTKIPGLKLTFGQKVAIALHSLNKQNMYAITTGGITIPNQEFAKKGNYKEALATGKTIKLTASDVKSIVDNLTPEQKEFAGLAYTFFNVDSKNAKNKTDVALYGFEGANVENYMPMVRDTMYLKQDNYSDYANSTLEGKSFNKKRVRQSKNPIILEGIFTTINRHIDGISSYYGLALPLRDLKKVLNYTEPNYKDSVKHAINQNFGSAGQSYVDNLIKDIDGNTTHNDSVLDPLFQYLRSSGAMAALGANLKVIVSQISGVPAAAAVIDAKYLAKATVKRVNVTKVEIEEMDDNIPAMWYRNQGYATIETGDITTAGKSSKLNIFTSGLQWADRQTMIIIATAAKLQIEATTNFEQGSAEYWSAVNKLAAKTIYETQPNYTVLQRAGILRSKSEFIKLITMFKSQPLQNYNIMYNSTKALKAAKKSNNTKLITKNKKQIVKASLSFATSAITFAIVTSIFNRVLRPDEEDKLLENVLDSVVGNIMGIGEFYNFAFKNYDNSNFATDGINLIFNSATQIFKIGGKIVSGKMESDDLLNSVRSLAKGFGQLTGIPVRNVVSLFEGMLANVSPSAKYKYDTMFATPSASTAIRNINEALASGDDKMVDAIFDVYFGRYSNAFDNSKAGTEIRELYLKTSEARVIPKTVPTSITYNDIKYALDKKEVAAYKGYTNNEAYSITTNLIGNANYQVLSDIQRVDVINDVYNYLNQLAKKQFLNSRKVEYELPSLYTKTFDAVEQGIDIGTYYIFKNNIGSITDSKDRFGKVISGSKEANIKKYVNSFGFTAKQTNYLMGTLGYEAKKKPLF